MLRLMRGLRILEKEILRTAALFFAGETEHPKVAQRGLYRGAAA